jgi:NTE family protein
MKNPAKSIKEIQDRRNELAGNLSLNQEIDFIKAVNKWVDLKYLPDDKYKHIHIERIEMLRDLDTTSKLDRNEELIEEMMRYGEEQAEDFLDKWQAIASES